jgi:hypothetical protein
MKRLDHPCERYRERLSLLASGALSQSEQGDVDLHLSECAGCREYFDELKRVTAPLGTWENTFARVEPSQAARLRWAREIKAAEVPQPTPFAMKFSLSVLWRELIWPCRRAWTGMAALWVVMLWINFGDSDHRAASLIARSKPAPGTWQALEEQRRLLAELIPPGTSQRSEPPRREPRPRSERSGARTAMSASPQALVRADKAVRAPAGACEV